ncbi:MAG TPA: TrmH family RNA methyltransferase [Rectinemataceae bacterium]|nr:TrmH family RNA methyltransferase [Rectinemataceae bacterium]
MFSPSRLGKLSPTHRLRKAALLLESAERSALESGQPEGGDGQGDYRKIALDIAGELCRLEETPAEVRQAAAHLLEIHADGELIRALDLLRHRLLRAGGQARADWDLIDRDSGLPQNPRHPISGLKAYFEDIRSPFNVGSMLRTGEALGLEEAILSPDCADPLHPRAARSAMGAASMLPWRRAGLESLAAEGPVFALELGGTALAEFEFPERGIVVLGSEELGLSSEALELCRYGRVSIPMRGTKASINVGVAFGIVLSAWIAGRP